VAAVLRQAIPEFVAGTLLLRDCQVKRLRLLIEHFEGSYVLSVATPGATVRTIALRVELLPPGRHVPTGTGDALPSLGEPGWRFGLPELGVLLTPASAGDQGLPAYRALTDPHLSRELLERAIAEHSSAYAGFAITECSPEIMRYKPGSRCTVRYTLTLPPDQRERGWPQAVIGKTWHGEKGLNAYRGMRDLWDSPLATSPIVRIAEPIAFLRQENVLVQSVIPGEQTFRTILRRSDSWHGAGRTRLDRLVERTACGLAALHSCGVTSTTSFTWDDELTELEERVGRLDALICGFGEAVAPAVAAVAELGLVQEPDPEVPSHISFRPAQILVDTDGNIGFIDFDGFCLAEPAVDIALFCVTLRDVVLRGVPRVERTGLLLDQLDALCETFITTYAGAQPVSRSRLAAWEALLRLNALVGFWTKAKLAELDDRTELLRRHLRTIGLVS
jgi:hypothetical protein